MKSISIIIFFTVLFCCFIIYSIRKAKEKKKRAYRTEKNSKVVYLTKKEIRELSRKNTLTHSWYKKRPGKNKGK